MNPNIGFADKIIRIIIGITVIVLGILLKGWWSLIGIVPVLTAFLQWSPLYALIGISTKNGRGKKK